jgi:DNA-3-methyladenine glycosylase
MTNEPQNPAPLDSTFYEPSARIVARRLLGHWLLRRGPDGLFCGGPIVETEAYLANDPASHGFRGPTARNRSMFGPPGTAYIYFIYGNHCCANAVCGPEGVAEAVLIRAVEAEFGIPTLAHNRPMNNPICLTNGPGKLCAAMAIDRNLDGERLFDKNSLLIIAENPNAAQFRHERGPIKQTTRVGLSQAADAALRFYLDASRWVSKRPTRKSLQSFPATASPSK